MGSRSARRCATSTTPGRSTARSPMRCCRSRASGRASTTARSPIRMCAARERSASKRTASRTGCSPGSTPSSATAWASPTGPARLRRSTARRSSPGPRRCRCTNGDHVDFELRADPNARRLRLQLEHRGSEARSPGRGGAALPAVGLPRGPALCRRVAQARDEFHAGALAYGRSSRCTSLERFRARARARSARQRAARRSPGAVPLVRRGARFRERSVSTLQPVTTAPSGRTEPSTCPAQPERPSRNAPSNARCCSARG